ncbi:demethylmenaquinone methyltransferase [Thermicanus aegyptius]|uniref:demethylmenaquinone methyltransferase n=1 Tax=Thermicanus aegyptius TaxID=94009 RepID=UPI000425AF31|nr:demethylmenaquinone methyltransferase [Thermicanus aegyptius]
MAEIQGKEKEQYVHHVFETIAERYDLMNTLLSFGVHKYWRNVTMKKMGVKEGDTALDVACGTGDWTIALAKKTKNPEGIYGLDFSRQMLKVAGRKLNREGLGKVNLVYGSALELPFQENRFDYATIGFALRNVPDIGRALQEMLRVVKPGGKIVSLELSKPVWPLFRMVYFFYFNHILPFLGKIFTNRYEQYKWLPQSLASFPNHRELEEIFYQAGCEKVETYLLTGGIAAIHIGTKKSV